METQYIEINEYGDKFYFSDKAMKILHRENGPACEYTNGIKYWYLNGQCHRQDGPAIEYTNGIKYWYFYNRVVTEAEHARLTKKAPTVNINGKEFTVEELNSLIETTKGN